MAGHPAASAFVSARTQELIAVVLMSLTAILTAWCGFEASKWGGATSIAFSEASSARIEASRLHNNGSVRQSVHVGLFAEWVQATGMGNTDAASFIADRFPEPLATAFAEWISAHPLSDPASPTSPFDMPAYALPEVAAADAANARADARYDDALRSSDRSDAYTILTVLFAIVLFFAALTGRIGSPWARTIVLGLAVALFIGGATLLAVMPKLL